MGIFALVLIGLAPSLGAAESRIGDIVTQLNADNPCWSLKPEEYSEIEKTYVCHGLSKDGLIDLKGDSRTVLKKMVYNLAAQQQSQWLKCYKKNLQDFPAGSLKAPWLSTSRFLLESYFEQRMRAEKLRAYDRTKDTVLRNNLVNVGNARARAEQLNKARELTDPKFDYLAEAKAADRMAEANLSLLGLSNVNEMNSALRAVIDEVVGPSIANVKDAKQAAEAVMKKIDERFGSLMEIAVKDVQSQIDRIESKRMDVRDGSFYDMSMNDWPRVFYNRGEVQKIVERNYPGNTQQSVVRQEKLLNCFEGDFGATTQKVETASDILEVVLLGGTTVTRKAVESGTKAVVGALLEGSGMAWMLTAIPQNLINACMKTRLEVIAASEKVCSESSDSGEQFLSKWMSYHSCLAEMLNSLSPI